MSIVRPLHPLLHRAIVTVLIVCGFACCCRDQALAAWWTSAAEPAAGACCGDCGARTAAGDGGLEAPREDTEQDPRPAHDGCRSSCCTKAGFAAPAFELACDRIGVPLADTHPAGGTRPAGLVFGATRFDDDVGRPPPWRLLLVSRRLRI